MPREMKILGIDPALTVTGYGLIDTGKNKLSLIEAGIIMTSPRQDMPERLNKIFDSISKLITDTQPDVLVLEKLYAHYRHPTTAYILGAARGVICLACARHNVTLAEYAATRVKKAIVGAGLASKSQVQRMVAGILNISSLNQGRDDITDALALAITHSYVLRSGL